MSPESSKSFAIAVFSTTEYMVEQKLLWKDFVDTSRNLYEQDKRLLEGMGYFNTVLQPFVQNLLIAYYQQSSNIGWEDDYNQTRRSEYFALLNHVEEQLKEIL